MKKVILAAALLVAGVSVANAEGYNRVAVSYDHTNLSFNKDAASFLDADGSETAGLNGFGLNYIHGFGVAENMFVETGANVDFLFGNKSFKESEDGDWWEDKYKFQNINIQVPVNFVYRFNLTEGVSLDPYIGLNFKLHLTEKYQNEFSDSDGDKYEGDWVSVFDDGEKAMDGKDYTWNRFQMGWHVGIGCNYEKYYLGVQVGTDFIPAYSHSFDGGYKPKVNTLDVKLSLGYTF